LSSRRAQTTQPSRPLTQNERILALLADGAFHTTREILQHVPCIVHSRIAELNKRGYRIEHDGAGGGAENHRYRLVETPEELRAPAPVRGSSGASADGNTASLVRHAGEAPDCVQLDLFEAAA
jgi:hypothetical protein